jgi:predicted nucleotidyltransferase
MMIEIAELTPQHTSENGGDGTTATEWIQRITERIVRNFDPLQIILFGSHARGEARPDSDIDLLVVFAHVTNKRQAAINVRRALTDFPVPKDIIVTSPEEIARRGDLVGTVLRPALQEGKTLYDRS